MKEMLYVFYKKNKLLVGICYDDILNFAAQILQHN
jgi:hypothetical protein